MSSRSFQRLNTPGALAWLQQHPDALVLDAREARHHGLGHLAGCVRLDGRNHEALLMRERKSRPVFIYCYHGNASQTYAQMFADFGFANVADLMGGFEAWQAQGGPVVVPDAPRSPAAAGAAGAATTTQPVPPALAAWLEAQGYADLQATDAHGNTPLMRAAWRGEAAIVEALLDLQPDLRAINGDGNNALWLGCVSNDPAIVTRLVQAGVPIDHANYTGATSLMYAASSSKPAIVRVLLELGADPHIQTQDDFTALDMAASVECLQLLRAATRARPAA